MTRNKINARNLTAPRRLLVAPLCLLLALVTLGCGEQRFEPLQAPAFRLPVLEGVGEVALEEYAGQVVYLTFWASWCTPCRQEMPYLAQLWQRHEGQGFQVLAINVDEDENAAREFADSYALPFPLLRDGDRAVSKIFRVPGYPTHFIVDRRGNIRFSGLGFNLNDVRAVSQEVATLLAEE
jgi:peroxiredoxin